MIDSKKDIEINIILNHKHIGITSGASATEKLVLDLINEIKDLLYNRRFTIKGAKQYLKDKIKQPLTVNKDQVNTRKEKVIY